MRHRARAVVAATLLAAILAAPLTATAVPTWAQADKHFKRGVQLFKESNHAAALVEFQRAYEIDPKYQVLYNIGESYYQLQDYANALTTFRRYLEEGGAKISPKRRKDVEAEIVTLSGRVATLTVETSEPGASIAVDDVAVGETPLAALTVSAGRRKVTATVKGRAPVTRVIDLAGGDKKTVELEIPALPKPVEVVKAPPPEPPSLAPTIITWSVTGALVTGAVVTGVLALRASSDLEAELARFPGDADALASAKDEAFGLGLATDILVGTSAAVAGLASYFTADWKIGADAAARAEASARVAVVPGGVVIEGRF